MKQKMESGEKNQWNIHWFFEQVNNTEEPLDIQTKAETEREKDE